MIIKSDNRVGLKEYAAILMLCISIKSTDSTPTLLYKEGKNAGWIVPLVSSFMVFISLSCLLALFERYKDKNFIDLIYHFLGKRIGFLLSVLIFGSMTALTASNIRNYADIMGTIYFRKTPVLALTLILVVSSMALAMLGFEAIGRVAGMVIPWIIIVMGTYIMLLHNITEKNYLFPIGGAGVIPVLKAGVKYSTIFSELITFSVTFKEVKDYKSFKTASNFAFFYNVIAISLFTATFLMVLDYPPVIINNSPFHTSARLIYGGRFISNLEAFYFLFLIVGSIVRFGMYIYSNNFMLCCILKIKDAKRLIPAVSFIVLAISLIPENFLQNVEVLRRFLINSSWIPIYITPIFLLFLSQRKGDYRL